MLNLKALLKLRRRRKRDESSSLPSASPAVPNMSGGLLAQIQAGVKLKKVKKRRKLKSLKKKTKKPMTMMEELQMMQQKKQKRLLKKKKQITVASNIKDKANAEAEVKRKAETEAKAKAKAKTEAKAKRKAETEAKAKAEAEAKRKAETEAKAKAEADTKAKAKAKAEAKAKAKAKAEANTKAEAKRKAETEAKAKAATKSTVTLASTTTTSINDVWIKGICPATSRTYWFNEKTGESTYENPDKITMIETPAKERSINWQHNKVGNAPITTSAENKSTGPNETRDFHSNEIEMLAQQNSRHQTAVSIKDKQLMAQRDRYKSLKKRYNILNDSYIRLKVKDDERREMARNEEEEHMSLEIFSRIETKAQYQREITDCIVNIAKLESQELGETDEAKLLRSHVSKLKKDVHKMETVISWWKALVRYHRQGSGSLNKEISKRKKLEIEVIRLQNESSENKKKIAGTLSKTYNEKDALKIKLLQLEKLHKADAERLKIMNQRIASMDQQLRHWKDECGTSDPEQVAVNLRTKHQLISKLQMRVHITEHILKTHFRGASEADVQIDDPRDNKISELKKELHHTRELLDKNKGTLVQFQSDQLAAIVRDQSKSTVSSKIKANRNLQNPRAHLLRIAKRLGVSCSNDVGLYR